jgi:fatty-acyl-CoA synthase
MEHHARDIVGHYGHVRARNVALINGDTGFSITWAQLDQQVGRLASALRNEFGIGHGDRVGLIADSEPKVFVLQYACMRLGAVFVPFNWRLTVDELAYQCGDADISVLIHDEIWAHQAKELHAHGGAPLLAWGLDDAPSEYTTLVERSEYLAPSHDASWDDVTHILYTSGTTGRPKGALSTHRSLAWQAINIASVDEVAAPDAHHLNSMPLFHAGGLNVFSNPILFFGGRVTTMARLDPPAVLRILGDPAAGVTHFTGVPTIYQMLTTFPEFQDTDYSHVRHAVCAGGIATPALLELWAAHGSPLEPQFGGTETGPTILMLDAHDLRHSTTGAVGVPIAHTDVRLVDPITGADVAAGEVGELLVRGPSITPGYWNRDPEDFFTDGYFRTGDALYRDDEGYFHYAGRFKDMYKSGGENVYAAEVEAVLQNVPGVAEIAIIGVPDDRWGEVGLAVVVAASGVEVTLASLVTGCDGILARYKIPKHLVLVDSLPRNVTGKVAKADLRTAYARGVPTA